MAGKGCAPASDFSVGGGVWFLGLVHVAVSFSSVMEESRVCVGVCVCVGRGAGRGWCVRPAFPSRRGRRGVIKWVLRGGRGVETNLQVRVRFPSVVMEVVGLWGHSWAGGRSEREARKDECGPMVQ